MKKWKKISDLIFQYDYKNERFIIQTLPFKIFKLPKEYTEEQIKKAVKQIKPDYNPQIPPTKYYLPLFIGTTNCNFSCKYCYADAGSYGEKPLYMDKKVIENSVKYITKKMRDICNTGIKKEIEIGAVFFGGESLLHFEGLKLLVQKMKEAVITLNKECQTLFKPLIIINTNGSMFTDEIIDYITKNKEILEVIISFDGLHHDKYRITKEKKPTSKIVIDGIKKIKEAGVTFSITCSEPPDEIEDIYNNIRYITELFGKETEINLSFIRGPIQAVKTKAAYPGILEAQYTTKSLEIFGEQVAKLIHEGYNLFIKRFENRVKEGGYIWRCPASLFEFSVYVDGSVYPCHNFIDDKFKLGHISDEKFDPTKKEEVIKKFKERTFDRIGCSECIFQTICLSSFDCPSHSYYDLGDFNSVDKRTCVAAKKIMEALLEKVYLDKEINGNEMGEVNK